MNSLTGVNSVFEQPWYIAAAAPENAQTLVYQKGTNTLARLPVVVEKRYGSDLVTNPPFTQTCGVWFLDQGGKLTTRLEAQKDAINAIVDQLPKRASVDLYLDHSCQYVLPWMWRGFKVVPLFSYRIEALRDVEECWSLLRDNIRTRIHKAEKLVTVRADLPIDTLIAMQNKTFDRQNRSNPINAEGLRRLDAVLRQHDACRLLCAVDTQNRVHAAAYFVYDEHCCYYLQGGGDPELRSSGAASLLLWEGIRFAATVSESFDFEGSMIEDIERFFRAFGGTPQVYYRVVRLRAWHRLLEWIKPSVKKLIHYQ